MKAMSCVLVALLAASAPARADRSCPAKVIEDCAADVKSDTDLRTTAYGVCRAGLEKDDLALVDTLAKRCEAKKYSGSDEGHKNAIAICKLLVAHAIWGVAQE